ncbi:MAG: hypothetical protein UY35_C0010G0016 [Candidatus Saccharibacteria bacterium GW2011_GWC2_48_9]|nr:MAG: hypothetical protein UY35_C0010G0016 [Candidatus Saccharibacteria bacterium GW2011_GWC2_48_9]HCH34021.1 hypothetical protein [Candidatus Saccharibacteria bacterium]
MHKEYKGDPTKLSDLDSCYEDFILPEFGIARPIEWASRIKTGPDNFLHVFNAGDIKYALAFDDYPSDFSVAGEPCVKTVRLENGEDILHISAASGKYAENITGAFMLFQIVDTTDFEKLLAYLEASYEKLQQRWREGSAHTIVVARDLLQLAETAARNSDSHALYAIKNIVDTLILLDTEDTQVPLETLKTYIKRLDDAGDGYYTHTKKELELAEKNVYSLLSKDTQATLAIQTYEAAHPGQTVTLASAMYARTVNKQTEGVTVRFIVKDDTFEYPSEHFINKALQDYFIQNPHINKNNIIHFMPDELQGYRLVEGSVYVRDVFERELEFIAY